jgi:hypothetical protein
MLEFHRINGIGQDASVVDTALWAVFQGDATLPGEHRPQAGGYSSCVNFYSVRGASLGYPPVNPCFICANLWLRILMQSAFNADGFQGLGSIFQESLLRIVF